MAVETVLKIVCGNDGKMDYERLLDLSYGLSEISDLDEMLENSEVFTVIQHSDSREVFIHTDLRLCKSSECNGQRCEELHLCKYELMTGHCGRRICRFEHQMSSEHNIKILRNHHVFGLSREELCVMLLQNDTNLLPPVCVSYNKGRGPYGLCPDKEHCTRLHVCEGFIRRRCDVTVCCRSHGFGDSQVLRILKRWGVSDNLMASLPFIYYNIHTLRDHSNIRAQSSELRPVHQKRRSVTLKRNTDNYICLSFVKGFCKMEQCWRIHFEMPYRWEVKVGSTWTALANNEDIERDFCDPANTCSSGAEPVCFEEMMQGSDEVRRLSTEPSVLLPSFILTTTWAWYWRDENNYWVQFTTTSSVCSDDLEQKYQECLRVKNPSDKTAVVKFRVGNHLFKLNFIDMKQRNEVSGRERPIRRRPVFVSAADVQLARSRRRDFTSKSHTFNGVPGFWDQSAIPASGFQRVRLQPSHRDYMKVLSLFSQTMSNFCIRQIERVQNKELWKGFITKKEEMKNINKEKCGERLLFHAIKSSLVDVVCRRNFDIEMQSDAVVYGRGIYFSKDAQGCHQQADDSGLKVMFVCRVLLGLYTRGDRGFHHPPAKTAGHLYDSCVDNPRDPSVFVLFDRSQIYPEFLVTYEENKVFHVSDGQSKENSRVVSPVVSVTVR